MICSQSFKMEEKPCQFPPKLETITDSGNIIQVNGNIKLHVSIHNCIPIQEMVIRKEVNLSF